jgi:hypothetical protein
MKNALQLANELEFLRWSSAQDEAAAMLRKQAESIKHLRKALDDILCSAADNNAAIIYSLIDQGKAALEATKS